jgi:hypothetical protein
VRERERVGYGTDVRCVFGGHSEHIPWEVENPNIPNRNLIFYRMMYTFFFYVMVTTILMK